MNPLARIPNPFKQSIMKDAWETPLADVPEIHAQAFSTCCRALENVRTSRQCDSVLLHGEAGSGKTHLLGRLQRNLTSPFSAEKDRSADIGQCLFLYCRLQTNPRRLWQHLRKTFVEDLLHRFPDGTTQLQRLVACRFAEGDKRKQRPVKKWLRWISNPANRDHAGWKEILLPWINRETGIDFSLQRVLYHLITGRHVLEAGAWLKGEDSLPEEALALLGVGTTEEGQTEDRAREVVLSLCRLASPRMPVAFCFDQIEALQMSRDDPESLFLFGQMGASLFNSSNNSLLISCIQSSVVNLFKESVREADYDRIAQSVEALYPLDRTQAYKLIQCRLDSQKELAGLRARYSQRPLWPFESSDFDTIFSPTGHQSPRQSPRKIISFAGTLFDKIKLDGVVAEPEDSSAFLKKEFERRLVMSLQQDVTESDITLAHGLPLLTETLGGQWHTERQPDKDIDFLLSHEAKRIALSLCNHQNMRSLGARFKRLKDWQFKNREVKLVLIRDQRLPISKSAVATRSHLQSLEEKGAVLTQPDAETLAALQALRSLLSDAKSGDLHYQGETLAPRTVQEWLCRNLDPSLTSFLGNIVEVSEHESDADSEVMGPILEVLKRHRIITLEAAAKEVQQPVPLIEEAVRRHPGLVGWLQGPPPVLFDYKPAEILRSKERDEG
jgi:hypothetical protein